MASAVSASIEIADREFAPAATEPPVALPDVFIVFDLETTGLDPDTNEIIEIGAIRVNRSADTQETFRLLVQPRHAVPLYITGLTGITQQMVEQEGVRLDEALNQFLKFIGDLPLVSYAAGFDMAFLSRALLQCHPVSALHNSVCCAMQLARRAWPFLPSFRLADVAGTGASFAEPPHRALGDCERALLVYRAAVGELQKLG